MASENNVHALQHTTLKTVNYAIYKCCMEDAMFLGILNLFSSWIFFALHVDSMGVFPKPLSKQKEDKEAKNKLIEHNLRLVAHIVKKYGTSSVEQDELISIGTVGLIKAVITFDYSKGAKFATYASRCIENEILMNFRASKKSAGDIFINEVIETDKDGNALTLMDIVDDGTNIDSQVDLLIRSEQLYKFLDKCLDKRETEADFMMQDLRRRMK